jgi:hypothetical protein
VAYQRREDNRAGKADYFVASEDAGKLALEVGNLMERAVGVQWYGTIGNDADAAAMKLCLLRRARAGVGGGPLHGDAAVREALESVSPAALVWIASRAISYMDENGYPEAMEPFLQFLQEPDSAELTPPGTESP